MSPCHWWSLPGQSVIPITLVIVTEDDNTLCFNKFEAQTTLFMLQFKVPLRPWWPDVHALSSSSYSSSSGAWISSLKDEIFPHLHAPSLFIASEGSEVLAWKMLSVRCACTLEVHFLPITLPSLHGKCKMNSFQEPNCELSGAHQPLYQPLTSFQIQVKVLCQESLLFVTECYLSLETEHRRVSTLVMYVAEGKGVKWTHQNLNNFQLLVWGLISTWKI